MVTCVVVDPTTSIISILFIDLYFALFSVYLIFIMTTMFQITVGLVGIKNNVSN